MLKLEGSIREDSGAFTVLPAGKTFQKRRVSSPAPVTMFSPSGLIAKYKTLKLWPVSVATFFIEGYFQTTIALSEYPWVETISLLFLEKRRLQTCEPVLMWLISSICWVFQKRMHLSAVPPPLAKRPCWCGDQAMALTAARWLLNLPAGSSWLWTDQTFNLLSFPPEASCCSSNDHFNPQTSCLWKINFAKKSSFSLRSLWRMFLSFDPELRMFELQDKAPILPSCPFMTLSNLLFWISQTWTIPEFVPKDKCAPLFDQQTDVTVSR